MSHLLLLLLAIMSILPVMLTPVDSREAFVGHASFFRRRHEARGCLRERARLRCLRRDHRRLVCMQRTDAGQSSPSSASGDGTASDEESCEVDGQEAAGPDAAWWEKMEEDNEMLDGNLEASSVKLLKDVSEDFLSKLPISRLLTTLIKPEDPVVVPAVGNVSSEYSEEEDGTARVEEDSPARKGDYSESLDPGTGTFSALGSEILVSTLTSSVSKVISGLSLKPERQSIPKNLLYCSNITDLLEELETICTVEEGGAGKREGAAWMKFQEVLKPEDAVLALNHIKRLEGQVGIDSIALNERKNRMFDHLAAQICKEMSALGPKHVALAATAVATRRRREEMMRAVTRRLLEMQADPVREFVFTEQTIAMLFNAFAKERRSEEQALSMLSSLVLNLSGGMKSLQNVAIILNSMARLRWMRKDVIQHLIENSQRCDPTTFTSQAVASVLNAAVRLDVSNENFFRFMSSYVKKNADNLHHSSQSLSIIANSFVKASFSDHELYQTIWQNTLLLPDQSFDSQSLATFLNCMLRSRVHNNLLHRRLLLLIFSIPPPRWNSHSLGLTANSVSRFALSPPLRSSSPRRRRIGSFEVVRLKDSASSSSSFPLPPSSTSTSTSTSSSSSPSSSSWDEVPQDIEMDKLFTRIREIFEEMPRGAFTASQLSILLNSFARVGIKDEKMMTMTARYVMMINETEFEAQDISLIANAFSKLEVKDSHLFLHLSSAAQRLPAQTYLVQTTATLLNACASAHFDHVPLLLFLSSVIIQLPPNQINLQHAGMILNSFSRLSCTHGPLFSYISRSLLGSLTTRHVSQASGQSISTIFHSLARLNVQDRELVTCIVETLPLLNYTTLSAQSVANIAWSSAVLRVSHAPLLAWLVSAVDFHLPRIRDSFLGQILLFIRWYRLALPPQEEGELLACRRSFDRWEEQIMCRIGRNRVKPVRSSELQRSVGAAAALLGLEVEEEVVEEDTGLSVDFFLPSLSLYIEVDGPFHYAVDLAEEEVDAGGGGGTTQWLKETERKLPLGSTIFKQRLLELYRKDVRVIPYWEWLSLRGEEEQRDYLKSLLQPGGGSSGESSSDVER
mmetsp:Transcript_41307/g.129892  ORF Transcript_41307/g.129892 Transcript_41307/m.129892 type:complete len:1079 (-) Transcript_41307:1648-4884(-)